MYFLLNLSHYVQSYGHLCQSLAFFTMPRSLNMAMSRDPRSKFRKKFYFSLILHLILGKAAKFLVEKLSTSEVISQKTSRGGVENTPPPPSAFRVNSRAKLISNANSEDCPLFQNYICILVSLSFNKFKRTSSPRRKRFVTFSCEIVKRSVPYSCCHARCSLAPLKMRSLLKRGIPNMVSCCIFSTKIAIHRSTIQRINTTGVDLAFLKQESEWSIFLGFESQMSMFFWVMVTNVFFGLLNKCCISECFIL